MKIIKYVGLEMNSNTLAWVNSICHGNTMIKAFLENEIQCEWKCTTNTWKMNKIVRLKWKNIPYL